METAYLLPLTVLALVLAVAALGFRAGRRRGYGPFVVGLGAAAGLLAGKFALGNDVTVYGSLAALLAASVWNAWPTRPAAGGPAAPAETLYQLGSIQKEQ